MKRFLPILILITAITALPAAELESPVFRGGFLFLGATDEDSQSPLLNSLGVGLPIRFTSTILLEPSIQFLGAWYRTSTVTGRTVPTIYEWRQVWVLGVMLDPAYQMEFPVADAIDLGFSVSPALLFRFPLFVKETEGYDASSVWGDFYGAARFLYPKTGAFLTWQATDEVSLRFQIDAWYPLFRAWDGLGLPFLDELIIHGWMGFSFQPKPKQTETAQPLS